jgi:hypothetical protein
MGKGEIGKVGWEDKLSHWSYQDLVDLVEILVVWVPDVEQKIRVLGWSLRGPVLPPNRTSWSWSRLVPSAT